MIFIFLQNIINISGMTPVCKIINFSSETGTDWIGSLLSGPQYTDERSKCPWNIETKYYTAEVTLHFVDSEDIINNRDTGHESMEAVIFNCDNTKLCLERSEMVWQRIRATSPAVCLYVVQTASDSVSSPSQSSRSEILDWCLTNQFELIQCDDADDDDDEFDEREGKERIISALKAHTWSNLVLSGESSESRIPTSDISTNNDDDTEPADDAVNIGNIIESLTVDDGDDVNFEDLFAQLSKIKEVSKNLPEHERKAYAEKVALEFYKSIGGSDSDDEEG